MIQQGHHYVITGQVFRLCLVGDQDAMAQNIKANGFDVLDIGRDVPIERFIDEAEKFGADIIGSSPRLYLKTVGYL